MNIEDFEREYSAQHKCMATYKDKHGDTVKGLLLDGIQTSLSGIKYVNLDSFYKSIQLKHIISVKNTGEKW